MNLSTTIGLVSVLLAGIVAYIAHAAGVDALRRAGRPRWPAHGRHVLALFLALLALNFANAFRVYLGAGLGLTHGLFALTDESTLAVRTALLASAIWFARRWRAGTLTSYPKG